MARSVATASMVNENNCKIQGIRSTNQEFQGFPGYFQGFQGSQMAHVKTIVKSKDSKDSKDFLGNETFLTQKILGAQNPWILGNTKGILGTLDLLSKILGFYSCFR